MDTKASPSKSRPHSLIVSRQDNSDAFNITFDDCKLLIFHRPETINRPQIHSTSHDGIECKSYLLGRSGELAWLFFRSHLLVGLLKISAGGIHEFQTLSGENDFPVRIELSTRSRVELVHMHSGFLFTAEWVAEFAQFVPVLFDEDLFWEPMDYLHPDLTPDEIRTIRTVAHKEARHSITFGGVELSEERAHLINGTDFAEFKRVVWTYNETRHDVDITGKLISWMIRELYNDPSHKLTSRQLNKGRSVRDGRRTTKEWGKLLKLQSRQLTAGRLIIHKPGSSSWKLNIP